MTPPKKPVSGETDKAGKAKLRPWAKVQPKTPRPGLTRDAIISMALEIVDKEGLKALSMRHLGSALEVDPMAVYYHIPNKLALLDALVEAVMGEIDLTLDDPSQPAPERIRVAAHIYREAMMAHPHAVQVIAVRNLNTPESFRPVEFLLEIFIEAGFTPTRALAAVNIFARFVRGFVLAEVQQMFADEEACNSCAAVELLHEVLPADEFPRMHEVMSKAEFMGPEPEFDLGVRALVRGMFEIFSENEDQCSENEDQTKERE